MERLGNVSMFPQILTTKQLTKGASVNRFQTQYYYYLIDSLATKPIFHFRFTSCQNVIERLSNAMTKMNPTQLRFPFWCIFYILLDDQQ
jgi:hypothetical protein